jgi:transcriptional regulator with XRE-family HTH domain
MYLSNDNVGHAVRALREARGMSQVGLAGKIAMTQSYLSQIEAGKRSPTLLALDRIFEGLDAVMEVRLKEDTD